MITNTTSPTAMNINIARRAYGFAVKVSKQVHCLFRMS